jgi:hypothetical protein
MLASMISFYFPERYIRDFISSSKIYYDPYPENSNIGARYKEMLSKASGKRSLPSLNKSIKRTLKSTKKEVSEKSKIKNP